ncbi:hypothetical protein GCM10009863_62060 [Streptomyces axinellae]|uniref:Uncharacterized protein n=1 Tax=Streptomyces axinellae TaxID=552788 RepID=A0ABN3QX10_9ACTN
MRTFPPTVRGKETEMTTPPEKGGPSGPPGKPGGDLTTGGSGFQPQSHPYGRWNQQTDDLAEFAPAPPPGQQSPQPARSATFVDVRSIQGTPAPDFDASQFDERVPTPRAPSESAPASAQPPTARSLSSNATAGYGSASAPTTRVGAPSLFGMAGAPPGQSSQAAIDRRMREIAAANRASRELTQGGTAHLQGRTGTPPPSYVPRNGNDQNNAQRGGMGRGGGGGGR